MPNYADYEIQISPTALQGSYGRAWQRAHGIVKDYYLGLLKTAVKMRFPDNAPSDALGATGDERSIDIGTDTTTGVVETLSAYAARVKNAWGADAIAGASPLAGLWYWGGTAFGVLTALAAQGYVGPNVQVLQQSGTTWSLNSGGALVISQGAPFSFTPLGPVQLWNSFLVYFNPTPASWTNILPNPTALSIPSIDEISKLRRIINLWRPGHTLCLGLLVSNTGTIWGFPGRAWGTGVWGGTTTLFPVPAVAPF